MQQISLDAVSKRYGAAFAVRDLSLTVGKGELLALLGPSGCGKSTTLRMIGGFVAPSSGRILMGDSDVTALPPYSRSTGMVFQGYALFPHMTVHQNVAFGLEMRKISTAEINRRVGAALEVVHLGGLAQRYPKELSGGQQQRTALARALVIEPDVLLLDEPLSNLDAKLRHEVRSEIRRIQQELGLTTVLVTHDQEEALAIADRLVLMRAGEMVQVGTTSDLYNRPVSRFVADFIGSSNFFDGQQRDGRFVTASGLVLAHAGGADPAARVLAVRPEAITLARTPQARDTCLSAVVDDIVFLGSLLQITARLPDGTRIRAHGSPVDQADLRPGDAVTLAWDAARARVILDA